VVRGERPGLRHALPPLPGLPPLPPLKPREWAYHDQDIRLRAGDEMGRFLLGSTVVLLLPPHKLAWNLHWGPGGAIRMGERMADWL
jgi:phosphatidylserine decarboxylase